MGARGKFPLLSLYQFDVRGVARRLDEMMYDMGLIWQWAFKHSELFVFALNVRSVGQARVVASNSLNFNVYFNYIIINQFQRNTGHDREINIYRIHQREFRLLVKNLTYDDNLLLLDSFLCELQRLLCFVREEFHAAKQPLYSLNGVDNIVGGFILVLIIFTHLISHSICDKSDLTND